MESIIIIYHNDPDGFGAAWAAWKKFGKKASYLPAENGEFSRKLKNKEIYFLDYCFNEKEFKETLKNNKKVVVIDHHLSRKGYIKLAHDFSFSVKNSASALAWKYFHPKKEIPKILEYVEDMDLFKWKLANSHEISTYMETLDFNFKIWDKFISDFRNKKRAKKYIEIGKAMFAYKDCKVRELAGSADKVMIDGQKAYVVNSPVFDSEIGNYIYKNKKAIGIIWDYRKKRMKVSLRSGGKIDVSRIAERHGGGGHKHSSGFRGKNSLEFPWQAI